MKTKKRIGFLAMSGVRAYNEELTRLGLTLPGFVDRNRIIASLPSLGLLNFALGMTAALVPLPPSHVQVASLAMIVGAVSMPLLCFLTAWRKPFRHLFPIPVLSVLLAAGALVAGWPAA